MLAFNDKCKIIINQIMIKIHTKCFYPELSHLILNYLKIILCHQMYHSNISKMIFTVKNIKSFHNKLTWNKIRSKKISMNHKKSRFNHIDQQLRRLKSNYLFLCNSFTISDVHIKLQQ